MENFLEQWQRCDRGQSARGHGQHQVCLTPGDKDDEDVKYQQKYTIIRTIIPNAELLKNLTTNKASYTALQQSNFIKRLSTFWQTSKAANNHADCEVRYFIALFGIKQNMSS